MEVMLANPHVNTTFSGLGSFIGDKYCIGPNCHDTLAEILNKLINEDTNVRSFRRAIGFSQVIKKDLLPLLYNVKNDSKIVDFIVKILVHLTVPVECLLPLDIMVKTDKGRNIIYELNWLLTSCKEAFLDPRSTRTITSYIQIILDKGDEISSENCESINNFLLLLRNILHIPEVRGGAPGGGATHQNQIVWNLFSQNLDKILIQLIVNKNRSVWVMVMVQLVPLIYKDQHVGTLEKLLSHWFDEVISESSEDNESNTSPQDEGSGDSSSMMTSDPTSDSSDNGGGSSSHKRKHQNSVMSESECKKATETIQNYQQIVEMIARKAQTPPHKHIANHKKENTIIVKEEVANEESQSDTKIQTSDQHCEDSTKKEYCGETSELSDRGYATQVENPESMSTSSNEDEAPFMIQKMVHQKPSNMIQKCRYPSGKTPQPVIENKTEWRKKKLIKRSRKNCSMNLKSLLYHSPTDDEISNILKEFTVDFMLKGYSYMVSELHSQLMYNKQSNIDTSHFFWFITYFLRFVGQLEIHLHLINSVLSFDILSYLTYEGLIMCEQLEVLRVQKGDINPCLRRIHLVVTSIKEIIQTLKFYKETTFLSDEDKQYLKDLQEKLLSTNDLKSLFLLLLRHFDPTIQSKSYLQDLIATNHILLMFLEKSSLKTEDLKMTEHIQQFANSDIIHQYGLLLEHFEDNGDFINNCIFTIMHHVAGDLDKVSVLFQPSILKAFTKIKESNFPVCEDWSDLIEYVINKFIKIPQKLKTLQENGVMPLPDLILASINRPKTGWSQREANNLYWYYIQSTNCSDPIGKIIQYFMENGLGEKSRMEVIEQLLKQDIIGYKKFEDFVEKEPKSNLASTKAIRDKNDEQNNFLDDIIVLREHLLNENKGAYVKWVQNCLLEACYAKLCLTNPGKYIIEPIAYHCAMLRQPTPLVTWTTLQRNAMQYQPFVLLLQKMGLQHPAGMGKLFASIPSTWSPEYMFSLASKLSPIDESSLKFDTALLNINSIEDVEMPENNLVKPKFLSLERKHKLPIMGLNSGMQSNSNWMLSVQQSKILMPVQPLPTGNTEYAAEDSDTDLTRMYVSDEDSCMPDRDTALT